MKQKGLLMWLKKAFVLFVCVVFLASCASMDTRQGKGTAWGTGLGAALGAGIGALTKGGKGALWGGLIGAGLGGLTGNQIGAYMDRQEAEFAQVLANSQSASLKREGDAVSISFKGDVYFDTGSAMVNPRMIPELDRVSSVLVNYPSTWIEVGGYADPRGSEASNLELSQRRADAVANELIARGVSADRIRVVGYGESQLLSGGNPENYGLDRRVVLRLEPMRQA